MAAGLYCSFKKLLLHQNDFIIAVFRYCLSRGSPSFCMLCGSSRMSHYKSLIALILLISELIFIILYLALSILDVEKHAELVYPQLLFFSNFPVTFKKAQIARTVSVRFHNQ